MKKSIFLFIFSIIFSINSYSASNTIYDTAVEMSRTKDVDRVIDRINNINNYFIKYILTTGDTEPTVEKVKLKYNLDDTLFTNYDKSGNIVITIGNRNIEFTNIFNKEPSDLIKKYIPLSKKNISSVIITNYNDIKIPFDSKVVNFIENVNKYKLDPKFIISEYEPTDKSRYWLQPNSVGGLKVYRYDENGKPNELGELLNSSFSGINKEKYAIINSIEDMDSIPKIDSLIVVISNGKYGEKYIYDNSIDKWIKISNASGEYSGLVNDIVDNIDPLVDRTFQQKYFDSQVDSYVKVMTILDNDYIEFKRLTDYWKSIETYNLPDFENLSGIIEGNVYVADYINDLPKDGTLKGSLAYLRSNNIVGYRGNDNIPEAYFDGNNWILLVPDIDSLITYGDPSKSYSGVIYPYRVIDKKLTFKHVNVDDSNSGYWISSDSIYNVTKGSRKDLLVSNLDGIYLSKKLCLLDETCSKDNISEPRYTINGILSDIPSTNSAGRLYKWLPIDSPLSINGLVDLPPCRDGYSLNLEKLRCEIDPICLPTYDYDKSINQCLIDPNCISGTYYDSSLNMCAISFTCPNGSIPDLGTQSCYYNNADMVISNSSLLSGYASIFSYETVLNIDDISKITDFRLIYARFDDYIKVEVNGNIIYVGPYGGDRMDLVWTKTNLTLNINSYDKYFSSFDECKAYYTYYYDYDRYCNPYVQYSSTKLGVIELNTNWSKSLNIDVKPYLKNGSNSFKITMEVTGYGGGYSTFRFTGSGITCISGQCNITATTTNPCPSGFIYSSGKCLISPTCSDGAIFDSSLDKCKLAPYCRDSDSIFDYLDKLCYLTF